MDTTGYMKDRQAQGKLTFVYLCIGLYVLPDVIFIILPDGDFYYFCFLDVETDVQRHLVTLRIAIKWHRFESRYS